VDFHAGTQAELAGMETRVTQQSMENTPQQHVTIRLANDAAHCDEAVSCAYRRVLEAGFPLAAIGVKPGMGVRFQLSLWASGLPVDAVPHQGWLEMATTNPDEMGG